MSDQVLDPPRLETRRPAPRTAVLGALVVTVAVFAISICVGARLLGPGELVDGLLRREVIPTDVVWGTRIPRATLAIIVGAALGLAGCAMQALTRNPLADPGLLGVDAGAAAAIVTAISVLGLSQPGQYMWFGLLGAGLLSVIVYLLGSSPRSGATPVRMALAGTAVSAVLTAYVSGVMITNYFTFVRFRFWDVGALTGRDLGTIWPVIGVIAAGLVLGLLLAPWLNVLSLGDETATGMGLNVTAARLLGVLAITLLCGGATAAVGPIAFVGLAAPHIARAMVGVDHRWTLPMSMLCGCLVLQSADIAGRLVIWPQEVGAGIVTAIFGAPVLIWLVRRGKVARL